MSVEIGWLYYENEIINYNDNMLDVLPLSMRAEIIRLKNTDDRIQRLLSKLFLEILFDHLFPDIHILEKIKRDKNNRPYCDSIFDFNISHTDGLIAVGLSTSGKIGIDVEKIQSVPLNELRNGFTVKEWEDILSGENKLEKLYSFWTKKESLVKAEGGALLQWDIDKLEIGDSAVVSLNDTIFHLYELDLIAGYQGWISCEKEDPDIRIKRYNLSMVAPNMVIAK